ncbi:MAG: sulfite exporter TauE/SafE family protein [Saprospiraceae bacterium]|nr:sulfite exporter TauE/SafE family protein [Saprospiraceae bacterium]
MEADVFMLFLVFFVAFLYSSVGHGGASGYIAVMALFGMAPPEIRVNALLLNIAVAGISFFQFLQIEKPDKKLAFPLFFSSIPMAYLGGSIQLKDHFFMYLLALILMLPVLRFSGIWNFKTREINSPSTTALLISGGSIGLLSGMLGIGGGIILTPLLLWFGWTNARQAALLSALFIVLNSAAGFLGLMKYGLNIPVIFPALLITAVAGGLIGGYYGSKKFSSEILKKMLAVVLSIAIFKLITF